MKRSTQVGLVAMGVAAVGFYALQDDGKTSTAHAFRTVNDCVLSGDVSAEICRFQHSQALAEHDRTAPRYTSRADCEAEFGTNTCEQRPSGVTPIFTPLFAGYLMGQMRSGQPFTSQPLYPVRVGSPQAVCPPGPDGTIPNQCPEAQRPGGGGGGGGGARMRTGHGTTIILDGVRGWGGTGTTTTSTRTTTTVRVPRHVSHGPPSRPHTVSRNGFGQTSRSLTLSSRPSGT